MKASALIHLNSVRALVCKALREGDMDTVKALLVAESAAVEAFTQAEE